LEASILVVEPVVAATGSTLAGVGRLAAGVVVAVESDWDRFELQELLDPEHWPGTSLGEFFGWHGRAAGTDSSRDKE
jgi:hypothetical protein